MPLTEVAKKVEYIRKFLIELGVLKLDCKDTIVFYGN